MTINLILSIKDSYKLPEWFLVISPSLGWTVAYNTHECDSQRHEDSMCVKALFTV